MFLMFGPLVGVFVFFFFNDTATTEIYTLSLHDALPIYLARFARRGGLGRGFVRHCEHGTGAHAVHIAVDEDRKSTRLNSSHLVISYAVFCLKKKTMPSFNFCIVSRRPSIMLRVRRASSN